MYFYLVLPLEQPKIRHFYDFYSVWPPLDSNPYASAENDENGIPNLAQRQLFFIDFFTYNFIKIDFDDTVKKQKIGIQL